MGEEDELRGDSMVVGYGDSVGLEAVDEWHEARVNIFGMRWPFFRRIVLATLHGIERGASKLIAMALRLDGTCFRDKLTPAVWYEQRSSPEEARRERKRKKEEGRGESRAPGW